MGILLLPVQYRRIPVAESAFHVWFLLLDVYFGGNRIIRYMIRSCMWKGSGSNCSQCSDMCGLG